MYTWCRGIAEICTRWHVTARTIIFMCHGQAFSTFTDGLGWVDTVHYVYSIAFFVVHSRIYFSCLRRNYRMYFSSDLCVGYLQPVKGFCMALLGLSVPSDMWCLIPFHHIVESIRGKQCHSDGESGDSGWCILSVSAHLGWPEERAVRRVFCCCIQ